jgi:glycosyltransferase involved in cell wall biosynthesis
MNETIAFIWDNFGPLHVDRCNSVAHRGFDVVGIEISGRSSVYDWEPPPTKFKKITLFPGKTNWRRHLRNFWGLVSASRRCRARHIFFCHYHQPAILFAAFVLRLVGRRVYTMNESKFDDFPRYFWREFLKRQFLWPYHGCLASASRTEDYFRFMGIKSDRIARGYDTLSVHRMRTQRGMNSETESVPFAERHFTIVARLVKKKNHKMALQAYQSYASTTANPRRLVLCGSGDLELELKALVRALALEHLVIFTGFVQTEEVSRILGSTLAVILPSTEEQFGQAIMEAVAIGIPVIASAACGVCDELVRTGVNGFVVEPDNADGLAWFMSLLAEDEQLWSRMAAATERFLPICDVTRFADGVERLIACP